MPCTADSWMSPLVPQERFEGRNWPAVHQALKKRISFYDHHVGLVTSQIQIMLGERYANRTFLMAVKSAYVDLLLDYPPL